MESSEKNRNIQKKTVASGVIGDPQRDRQSISLFLGCYGHIYSRYSTKKYNHVDYLSHAVMAIY